VRDIFQTWRNTVSIHNEGAFKVRGYIKPVEAFHTLAEWKAFATEVLALQKRGASLRGGAIDDAALVRLVQQFYSFQLDVEVERYELLTTKNVLDHIEDFVNHRVWALHRAFGSYFDDGFDALRFAFFYSRGDMEPYVLLDEAYTLAVHGDVDVIRPLKHYTTEAGWENIQQSIDTGNGFDIASFTVADRPFFRAESDVTLVFNGLIKAAFRSDVKSFAVSNGLRAANMLRLEYPGDDATNICYDLESGCDDLSRTSLWNEIIARPLEIIKVLK